MVRDITATPLVDHHERLVYVTDGVVTKVDTVAARLTCETRVTAALYATGCPVPRVIAAASDSPAVFAMSFVEGEPLGFDSPDEDWAAVGAALRRVHDMPYESLDVPVFGGRDTWRETFEWWPDYECGLIAAYNVLTSTELESLRHFMNSAFTGRPEPDPRLLHGDCGPYHWLLDDGRVTAALDFGDASIGDVIWDLAVLTLYNADRIEPVLDGYEADASLRSRVAELLLPYQVMRHFGAHSWLVEHDVDPTPTTVALKRIAATL